MLQARPHGSLVSRAPWHPFGESCRTLWRVCLEPWGRRSCLRLPGPHKQNAAAKTHSFARSSGGRGSRLRHWQHWFLLRPLSWVCRGPVFPWPFLCVCLWVCPLLTRTGSDCVRSHPHDLTCFSHLLKDPVSKQPLLRFWGVAFNVGVCSGG